MSKKSLKCLVFQNLGFRSNAKEVIQVSRFSELDIQKQCHRSPSSVLFFRTRDSETMSNRSPKRNDNEKEGTVSMTYQARTASLLTQRVVSSYQQRST